VERNKREALLRRVSDLCSFWHRSCTVLGGVDASLANRDLFSQCLESWLILTEDLMIRVGISEEGREQRIKNFVRSLSTTDLVDVFDLFDRIFFFLISEDCSAEGFKHLLTETKIPSCVIKGLLSPINTSLFSFLGDNDVDRPNLLKSIAQFLRFPLRLSFQAIGLEEKALESYLEIERDLKAMPPNPSEIILSLRGIVKQWFNNFRVELLTPCHGPGSVAEGPLTTYQKFTRLTTDQLLEYVLIGRSGDSDLSSLYPLGLTSDKLIRKSRTIFVPKTVAKLRTISMEPVSLQYIQQGVMYDIYRYIEKHHYLWCRLPLRDQRQNQLFAWEGSKYRNFCTIDLSHASDSVSWSLVRDVFCSVPALYSWLLATRSKETLLPDGSSLQLSKFAPMGSALCFPIESILFAAVIEHVSRSQCTPSERSKILWTVYGDDLVVPPQLAGGVINILQLLGFTVNSRKTFLSGPFRESCGKDYYDGVDISSLYYRVPRYNRERISPSVYGSWCSSANNALSHCLPLYRWSLITKILSAHTSVRGKPYFCSYADLSPYLYSSQPTNFHVKRRWSKRYQRWEGRFLSVSSKQRGDRLNDGKDDSVVAYHIKLVQMARRSLGSKESTDELSPADTLHGCVEFFRSTVKPIEPYIVER